MSDSPTYALSPNQVHCSKGIDHEAHTHEVEIGFQGGKATATCDGSALPSVTGAKRVDVTAPGGV